MQIVLTARQEITSKKGGKFTILRGVDTSGETVELFLNEAQVSEFDVGTLPIASKEQLKDLFKELPVVEVEFNQRGRVFKIAA